MDAWCDEILDAPIYILVIDHSGSMLQNEDMTNAAGEAVNRWEYMRQLAADFLQQSPLGTTVILYVFEAWEEYQGGRRELVLLEKEFSLASPEERTAAAEYVLSPEIERDIPDADAERAGTALYDTLARAFERAEFECDRHPGAHVRVMAYTDITAYSKGEEEHSEECDRAELGDQFTRLVEENENVFLFFMPLGEEQKPPFEHAHVGVRRPEHPIPIYVLPNRVLLRHPKEVSAQNKQTEQEVTVYLCLSRDHEQLFGEKPVPLEFESDEVEAQVVGQVRLKRGLSRINLKVTNAEALSVDQKYRGRLKLLLPEVAGHEIHLTPPNGVEIEFEPPGPVPLRVVYPRIEEGEPAVFALDAKIPFRVEAPQTATVNWDFPDEWNLPDRAGPYVPYLAEREGDFEVVVTASAPGFQDAEPVKLPVKILDIGVNIKQAPPWIVAGQTATIECVGHGPVQRYEWLIQGKTWPGDDTGLTIDHQFLWPGTHSVNVRAIHPTYGIFPSRESCEVVVYPRQRLRLVSPTRGAPYGYALSSEDEGTRFVVEATGGLIDSVDFSITSDDGTRSLASGRVSVGAGAGPAEVAFLHPFDEKETLDEAVQLTVTAVMRENCPLQPPADEMRLEPTPFEPKIFWPPDEQYGLGEFVPFRIECDTHRISANWDFGDGSPKKEGAEVAHRYERHRPDEYTATLEVVRQIPDKSTTISHLVVLDRKPPRGQLDFLNDDGEKSLKFAVGEPIQAEISLAGDVGTRLWEEDGEPRGLEKTTISYDEPGEHTFRLKAWWKEEDRDGVGEPAAVVERTVLICRNSVWLFRGVLISALVLFAVICYLCTRNRPLGWSIGVSHDKDRFGPLRTDVKGFWSRRTKKATISLSAIMKDIAGPMKSTYWTTGPGSRTDLIVTRLKRGKSVRGALNFSDKGNRNVTFGSVEEEPQKRVYELLDARAPDDEPLRHVFFELDERDKAPVADFVILAVSFLVLLGVVLATASYAFSCNV